LPNVSVTFSLSENNTAMAGRMLACNINVAAVFNVKRGKQLPIDFLGAPVIDGDLSDNRFLDPVSTTGHGYVIGLRAKGKAMKDTSGFVQQCKVA